MGNKSSKASPAPPVAPQPTRLNQYNIDKHFEPKEPEDKIERENELHSQYSNYGDFHGSIYSPHVTFFVPIFAAPAHLLSFVMSTTLPYVDPLFSSFVLAPWWEQVTHKHTNEEFLANFQLPSCYWKNNYSPKGCDLVHGVNAYRASGMRGGPVGANNTQSRKNPALTNGPATTTATVVPPTKLTLLPLLRKNEDKPQLQTLVTPGLFWRPERIEFEWGTVFPHSHETSSQGAINSSNDLIKNQTGDRTIAATQNDKKLTPKFVPFLKIGFPVQGFTPISTLTSPARARADGRISFSTDNTNLGIKGNNCSQLTLEAILPLRNVGRYYNYGNYTYHFEKELPYHGRTDDPNIETGQRDDGSQIQKEEEIKEKKKSPSAKKKNEPKPDDMPKPPTEYDIYHGHKYPRPSLVQVRALDGYAFDMLLKGFHFGTVPCHHLATILILDVSSSSSLVILNHFIRQTLAYLQRGCIIPLTNVPIHVILLNADKVDQRLLHDHEILQQLTNIGFDNIRIFTPKALPSYVPVQPPATRIESEALYESYPMIEKEELMMMTEPIWADIYHKIFSLHHNGHWDTLANQTRCNTTLIPQSIFPITKPGAWGGSFDAAKMLANFPLVSKTEFKSLESTEVNMKSEGNMAAKEHANKSLEDAKNDLSHIKFLSFCQNLKETKFVDADHNSILRELGFKAFYRSYQLKALEYFGALELIKGGIATNNFDLTSKPNSFTIPPNVLKYFDTNLKPLLKSPYDLFFKQTRPSENIISFLPHFHLSHFIQNPQPIPFAPGFRVNLDGSEVNSTLPMEYQSPHERTLLDAHPGPDADLASHQLTSLVIQHSQLPLQTHPFPLPVTLNTFQTNNPTKSLYYQLSELNLPLKYEFESFLIFSTSPVISDANHIIAREYFYEPHVKYLVTKAVKRVWEEALGASNQVTTASTTTLEETKPSKPNLQSFLPLLLIKPSPDADITPLDYYQWTSLHSLPLPFVNGAHHSEIFQQGRKLFESTTLFVRKSLSFLYGNLHDNLYERICARSVINGNGHVIYNKNQWEKPGNLSTKTTSVPLLLKRMYPTAKPLTFTQSRVESKFGRGFLRDGDIDREIGPQPGENEGNTIDVGITYLHRSTHSRVPQYHKNNGIVSAAVHPFANSAPFLPLAWLHGVHVIPFVYLSKETTPLKDLYLSKLDDMESTDNSNEKDLKLDQAEKEKLAILKCRQQFQMNEFILNRTIGHSPLLSGFDGEDTVYNKPLTQEQNKYPQRHNQNPPKSLPLPLSTYPDGFIPPPIPPPHFIDSPQFFNALSPYDPNQLGLIETIGVFDNNLNGPNHNNGDKHSPDNGSVREKAQGKVSPFTVPRANSSCALFSSSSSCQNGLTLLDPGYDESGDYGYPTTIAHHQCPVTFVVLVLNPIDPDEVSSGEQFETEKEFKGDNVGKTVLSHHNDEENTESSELLSPDETNGPPLFEPISQSQFRYFQEYIPIMWKQWLTDAIFDHQPFNCSDQLDKRWSFEVHTPATLVGALKRAENDAIRTRLELFRDLALYRQQKHQDSDVK